ncbi:MAG: endonuclease/exonuclease/phosphatase family protein [Anaerolinea sp.]|nr:endonuclease/exonuclease/phosphatase family protein [Anaerolinea sp.]
MACRRGQNANCFVQALRQARPDLIGLQEVTPRQFHFLQAQLPEFTPLTVPVTDPTPEAAAVWQAKYARFGLPDIPSPYETVLFYRTDMFELLATDHWWLSPTPERPFIGLGNSAPRVVLWAHLRPRALNEAFVIFNTHIDHRCPQEMVALCREKFTTFTARAASQIFIGDLNFNPGDPNYALLIQDGWRDAHEVTAAPEADTFLYNLPDIPGGRIDHILYRGRGLEPRSWMRLASPDPDRRISDHDPVCVRFAVGEGESMYR